MKDILNKLIAHHTLSFEEAKEVLVNIAKGEYNQNQIAVFLTVYMMRPIKVEEIQGFREALMDLCIPINFKGKNPIDLCGTGGDGKDTFNVSTLASFVVAGAGVPVAKHGNYGVSSNCGSSNVLEYLGVNFSAEQDVLSKQLDETNICFLHAPLFHPAMKTVGPIRKEIGMKTFFNMLGPMVNPSNPQKQIVGVFNLELARVYGYLYQQSGKDFTIIHALDGYDEVSLTCDTKIITNRGEEILRPKDFGAEILKPESIKGGAGIPESAKIFTDVLNSDGTSAQNSVVCANAALSIACYYPTVRYADAYAIAKETLESGKAKQVFTKLLALQK
jgi:anthranilate phosphoribosyltransferase